MVSPYLPFKQLYLITKNIPTNTQLQGGGNSFSKDRYTLPYLSSLENGNYIDNQDEFNLNNANYLFI